MLKKQLKTVFVQYTIDKIALINIIYFGGKSQVTVHDRIYGNSVALTWVLVKTHRFLQPF